MKSIFLIIPYFGQWPLWFEAYLCSIKSNPSIHWLCPTDCKIPEKYPDNIKFIETTLPELNKHVNKIVQVEVPLTPRKLCDLRLAYGDIFKEDAKDYDFWGFCDMDIVWGDIRKFMTPEILNNHDIISSRKENISGHFTLIKNKKKLNFLYKAIPQYKDFLQNEKLMRCDEELFTIYLQATQHSFQIKWDRYFVYQENGSAHQEYELNRWLWKDGQLINTKTNQEVMYLHFINWKRTMSFCEISYTDVPKPFYVSYLGMHYMPFSKIKLKLNAFKNLFFGYHKEQNRRVKILKLKSLKKRIRRKINKINN